MDAPNPLMMEGRDNVACPPGPPKAPPGEGPTGELLPRGNADRDKFDQPVASAGEIVYLLRTVVPSLQHSLYQNQVSSAVSTVPRASVLLHHGEVMRARVVHYLTGYGSKVLCDGVMENM